MNALKPVPDGYHRVTWAGQTLPEWIRIVAQACSCNVEAEHGAVGAEPFARLANHGKLVG